MFLEQEENAMNRDIWEGKWLQWKGKIKQQWGKLTDDDLARIEGDQDQLVGAIQERYGRTKEAAAREWAEFMETVKGKSQEGA